MDYNGADGPEFGAGNTKIDLAVLKGKLQAMRYSETLFLLYDLCS